MGLCWVSGTEGIQCTAFSRKDALTGVRSAALESSRAGTLMPISGMSQSTAATRVPQMGQKPRSALPGNVSNQVGSPPSPVHVTRSKATHHFTGAPPSFTQCPQ